LATTEEDIIREDHQPHVAVVGRDKCYLVVEGQVVVRDAVFSDAMHHMFCLFYVLNLEYPVLKKRTVDYFTFVQKVLFELDGNKLNPKFTTFVNALARAVAE